MGLYFQILTSVQASEVCVAMVNVSTQKGVFIAFVKKGSNLHQIELSAKVNYQKSNYCSMSHLHC